MAIITLATDYGTEDGYAAAVKGVLKTLSPQAEIIDITHGLSSILKTSLVLSRYYLEFPPGTVHLVVIDPTVGSSRRAIAGQSGGRYFVGPDNGIFTNIIENAPQSDWIEIKPDGFPPRPISPTFHGRDIFAPAAASLANEAALDTLGRPIKDPVCFSIPRPAGEPGRITGEIIDIDSFGNLIINIPGDGLGSRPKVVISGTEIAFAMTYADVAQGSPLAYIGSLGFLEIAINMGRAAEFFGATVGSKVVVEL
jgi:hypothetical protein